MAFSCIAASARDRMSINSSVSGSCLVLSCLAQEDLLGEVGKFEHITPIITYHIAVGKYWKIPKSRRIESDERWRFNVAIKKRQEKYPG